MDTFTLYNALVDDGCSDYFFILMIYYFIGKVTVRSHIEFIPCLLVIFKVDILEQS